MISYRTANLYDLESLIRLENKCFNPYDCFSPKIIKRMILNPNHSIITDVILDNKETVGYAVYFLRKNSKKIRLYSICVPPEHAGKHYGKTYLRKRMLNFVHDFTHITLEVRQSNQKAIYLYDQLGFKKIKLLPFYYSDGENGLKLEKRILYEK